MQDAVAVNQLGEVSDEVRLLHNDGRALRPGFVVVLVFPVLCRVPLFWLRVLNRSAGDVRSQMTGTRTSDRAPEDRRADECCNSQINTKVAHGFPPAGEPVDCRWGFEKKEFDGCLATFTVLPPPKIAARQVSYGQKAPA